MTVSYCHVTNVVGEDMALGSGAAPVADTTAGRVSGLTDEGPDWPGWSVERPVAMLFDIESRAEFDWRAGEQRALAEVTFRTPDR